jgi:cation diffusion facilitator CzcD-associated flavoprotein CzcO
MHSWSDHMPAGMRLKSDGFASDLYDARREFTLASYCGRHDIPYENSGLPVAIETFIAYGLAFQREKVPTLEVTRVRKVRRVSDGFLLDLTTGESLKAWRVVVATGISGFEYVPDSLASLPPPLCSHSSAHRELDSFRGKEVVVIGAGASATDTAAALHRQHASVTLVARHPVEFHKHQPRRSIWKRLTEPNLGLGPNRRSAVYTLAPGLFRHLPAKIRHHIVRTHLGPAGGWFVRDDVIGKVQTLCDHRLLAGRDQGGRAVLDVVDGGGKSLTLQADHVIAATGYRVSLPRLDFLDPDLIASVVVDTGSPVLSGYFESSVPGLYFIGLAAAVTFGPLLRFALGARYSARRLAAHLRANRAPAGASGFALSPNRGTSEA